MKNIITPYAEVLLDFVREEKDAKQIYSVLYAFKKSLEENPQYLQVLSSPRISREMKKQALEEVFPEKNFLFVRKTLLHLLENHHFSDLPAILTAFSVLFEEAYQMERVIATTAVPLSSEMETQLVALLEKKWGKEIFLENRVDPHCMGGLILSFRTQQYDASLQKTFLQIRQELSQKELLFAEEREVSL